MNALTQLIKLDTLIDQYVFERGGEPGHEDTEPRAHLGASIIGRDCYREIWYSFRWFTKKQFEGRMLRLFATGFKYEKRFIAVLEMVGVHVDEYDYEGPRERLMYHPESDCYYVKLPGEEPTEAEMREVIDVTDEPIHEVIAKYRHDVTIKMPKQYRFSGQNGHYGGSMDGQAWGFEGYWTDSNGTPFSAFHLTKGTRILTEFKTHNAKSFAKLKEKKVRLAKPEHYVQMCTYMESHKLPLALYCAVCKDTDELYFEFVEPNQQIAMTHDMKAGGIITAMKPPSRISESPSWFGCTFCDHRLICHYGQAPERNCRTCRFSYPAENGTWKCQRWNHATIPFEAQKEGCHEYSVVLD